MNYLTMIGFLGYAVITIIDRFIYKIDDLLYIGFNCIFLLMVVVGIIIKKKES